MEEIARKSCNEVKVMISQIVNQYQIYIFKIDILKTIQNLTDSVLFKLWKKRPGNRMDT